MRFAQSLHMNASSAVQAPSLARMVTEMTAWRDKAPNEVATAASLSRSQKLALLRDMELDAEQLAVAEEENMGGGEHASLRAIRQAIHSVESQT